MVYVSLHLDPKTQVLTVGADVWSARARAPPGGPGTCGGVPPATGASVADMGGTSMAAPIAAGGAALIRQYFFEGWFPTGKKVPGNGFAPSGALVRAVMMNSGRPLGGFHDVSGDGTDRWEALDTRLPNNLQGWGSLRLETSLFFDPPTALSARKMFLRDDAGPFATACLATGGAFTQSFSVKGGEPFRAMLAWTDPPASLIADKVLINDLDLRVHGGGDAKVRWGNRFDAYTPLFITTVKALALAVHHNLYSTDLRRGNKSNELRWGNVFSGPSALNPKP